MRDSEAAPADDAAPGASGADAEAPGARASQPPDAPAASAAPPEPVLAREVVAPQPAEKPAAPPGDPLSVFRWLAILGVVALILGRFVAPALPGAVVGMNGLVRAVELVGAISSQLFALTAIVGLCVALIHSGFSSIPLWIRLLAMSIGAYSALVLLGGAATLDRVPETSVLIAGAGAGAFAIVAAVASRASRVARLAGAVAGLVGAAALVRALRGLVHLYAASAFSPPALVTFGRVAVTLSTVLIGLAAILAMVHVSRSARPSEGQGSAPQRASLWTPATLVVLVLAVLCARQAAAGAFADAGTLSVVLKRASDRFLVQPEPFIRGPLRLFLGFLTPLAAAALLTVRRVPMLAAALSLLLVAADVTDAPLGAMILVLASLGVLLVARSGHVLWSALVARPPAGPASY